MTQHEKTIIDDYLASILQRFWNMKEANVDVIGITKAVKMVEGYQKTGTISPREFRYIFDRTHPLGELPKYNKTGKKWGLMNECPVDILIEEVVDWSIPATDTKSRLARRIPNFWDLYNNSTYANKQVPTMYRKLFKEE